ncbi:MAG: hypothetical protein J6Y23_13350 [Prevotella sp.]|nr:hypothetical protein [Prevotella sp.]
MSISLGLLLAVSLPLHAQNLLPSEEGDRSRYEVTIQMDKGYFSGVCAMLNEGRVIQGSIFNEFGITAIDFSYDTVKKKVRLHTVFKMMNKWYIRRVLRKDLACLIDGLKIGETQYVNKRHHITYRLVPVNSGEPEDSEE